MSLAEQNHPEYVGIALRRPRVVWNADRDARIKELFERGTEYEVIAAEISAEFGEEIGRKSVRDRCFKIGLFRVTSAWTPEIDADLLQMVKEGISYREAVPVLNARYGTSFSRCALIGRARRLGGFEPRPRLTPEQREARRITREARRNKKRRDERRQAGYVPRLRIVRPAREDTVLRCAEIQPLHVSLLDLERHQCRWPYGDGPYSFCGHQVGKDTPYCMPHYHLSLRVKA